MIWLKPTDAPHPPASAEGAYDCPLYKTTSRGGGSLGSGSAGSNFICYVRLPSEDGLPRKRVRLGRHDWLVLRDGLRAR